MPASSDRPTDSAEHPLSSPVGAQGIAPTGDEATLTVTLPDGVALHARPAADLVRAASKLPTPVTIAANGKRANARSILDVLALGAAGGTELTLSASGPDATEAVNVIASVVNGFGA
jgi:phosphotransferase system HPr (HPr) family protein